MTYQTKQSQFNDKSKLESFDDLWALGDPIVIEKSFHELLPQAKKLQDPSIYLQILSQIALTQALQKKFDEAHETLNDAERFLSSDQDLARVRILLERGRVFQQADDIIKAKLSFIESYELSAKNQFDYHTINAAHMIAIVEDKVEDKIRWNQLALKLAQTTKEQRASLWLGSLYNNLGQNHLEARNFEEALVTFQEALIIREKEAYAPNIRVAKWAIARALRFLDRLKEAEAILFLLLEEYDALSDIGHLDLPVEMFKLLRGYVYEELAELSQTKSQDYAKLAYDDLYEDGMFRKTEVNRLERLKQMQQTESVYFKTL